MIEAIANGIQSIIDFFSMVIDFIITLFRDLAAMAVALTEAVAQIPNYLGFFPPAILALLLTVFGVVVIYKILGRD